MKKFLLPFLLAFAILIPAAQTQAADVPGFFQVNGRNYLTFTGKEGTGNGYRVYGYDCSVDLNEDFAEEFMSSLSNFRLVGHFVNDYKGKAKSRECWIFVYTGSKNVSKFEYKNLRDRKTYYGHLVVGRTKNWQTDITHFSIRVAYGLTYGED
ncbi:MAG: hypothetical protein IKP64_04915 [Selenomonadaceae bacterium]|nr:hypothetical protein [Selenomonadaceae bacterium]MBR4382880.1 hypothetical protein [Selenomonadaceae bacterium]